MCVIYYKCSIGQRLYQLEPPANGRGLKRRRYLGCRHAQLERRGKRECRVGGAELARTGHRQSDASAAMLYIKRNSERGRIFPLLDVCNRKIRSGTDTAGDKPRTGRQRARHVTGIGVVGVNHRKTGVGHKLRFAVAVFLKRRVFARADVVAMRKIGEDADVELQSFDPPGLVSLRRHLNYRIAHAAAYHIGKRSVQKQAFRRGVGGRRDGSAYIYAVCADARGDVRVAAQPRRVV